MNLEKTIIDGDLWYIDNFLTEEELAWLKPYMDDPKDWYVTMRSPYQNILNKFIGSIQRYDEDGNVLPPDANTFGDPNVDISIFSKPGGIWDRIRSVMPEHYDQHSSLQSFKYIPSEEIPSLLNEQFLKEYQAGYPLDYAMNWHVDQHEEDNGMIASFSIYLNDDFEGGVLQFMEKPYVIEAKAGRFVNIPITNEFRHRVSILKSGNNRHTLYGNCWRTQTDVIHSEDC
ncbi:Oxoglutarate/iron-dependent dioxygenase [uncultured Caudovirales phage]|uniref:Oxoglutarate/iron-dependent dioxygenase n=1 Tax=uncultured Caudovirales phage TaxID=2100421 RepID=A0A6J7WN57_9CAUD|nr:Oxoglutarate/iron-dependent dioxygenase [uncultured Caudovirales phage]